MNEVTEHENSRAVSGSRQQRLVMLRKRAGISQSELARQAGVTPSAISMIEDGKREPRLSTALQIADALGVSLDVLAGRKEYPHNEFTVRAELIKLQQRMKRIKQIAT